MATLVANTRTINIEGGTSLVQWRRLGETAFKPGPPLVNGRAKLIMLEPGVTYEVLANGVLPQAVTTRPEAVPKLPGGRVLEADPTTFSSLLSGLLPGDTLRLRGGTYQAVGPSSFIVGASGAEQNYITIEAYPGEEPVFTSAKEPALAWSQFAGPVWSTILPMPALKWTAFCIWEGDRFLWRYSSLEYLQALRDKDGKPGGVAGGFYHNGNTLFIRTVDDGSPVGRELHISYDTGASYSGAKARLLVLQGSYLHVRGLKFKWSYESITMGGDANIVEDCDAYACHHLVRTRSASRGLVRNSQCDGGPGYTAYMRQTYN